MQQGDYVIVRSNLSGVWAGTLKSEVANKITLANARRLWLWWAAEGVSLSGVAAKGIHPKKAKECRIAVLVTEVIVMDAFEVLAVSDEARASIERQEARS